MVKTVNDGNVWNFVMTSNDFEQIHLRSNMRFDVLLYLKILHEQMQQSFPARKRGIVPFRPRIFTDIGHSSPFRTPVSLKKSGCSELKSRKSGIKKPDVPNENRSGVRSDKCRMFGA